VLFCVLYVCIYVLTPGDNPIAVNKYINIYDHLQGAREQYFMQLLSRIPLVYVRCVFVQYAAVCHYRRFVCVSGAAARVRFGLV